MPHVKRARLVLEMKILIHLQLNSSSVLDEQAESLCAVYTRSEHQCLHVAAGGFISWDYALAAHAQAGFIDISAGMYWQAVQTQAQICRILWYIPSCH